MKFFKLENTRLMLIHEMNKLRLIKQINKTLEKSRNNGFLKFISSYKNI